MAYSYTPAFIAFSGGAPLEEIAAEFAIPMESLQTKVRQEGWRTLANRIANPNSVEIVPDAQALDKCTENRAKNFQIAAELRADLMVILARLRTGTLKFKKYYNKKGEMIEYEAEPSVADRNSLANYATAITNLTYRALGDHAANGGPRADAGAGEGPPEPPLTVFLPAAVALPRHQRKLNPQRTALCYTGPTIEVESAVVDKSEQTAVLPAAGGSPSI